MLEHKVLLEPGHALENNTRHLQVGAGVRRVTDSHQSLGNRVQILDHGRTLMCKGIERVLAVVVAHTGRSSASKGQVALGHMHQCIVYQSATGACRIQHLVDKLLVAREHIQRQRIIPRVDILDRIVDVVDTDHGQDRAKQLVLHQLVVPVDVGNDCGGNVQVLLIGLATDHDLAGLVLGQDLLQAVVVAVVDDAGVAVRGLGVGAVELLVSLLHGLDELGLGLGGHQDVVGGDTGLITIKIVKN